MILNSTIILAAVIIGYPIWKLARLIEEHHKTMKAHEEER